MHAIENINTDIGIQMRVYSNAWVWDLMQSDSSCVPYWPMPVCLFLCSTVPHSLCCYIILLLSFVYIIIIIINVCMIIIICIEYAVITLIFKLFYWLSINLLFFLLVRYFLHNFCASLPFYFRLISCTLPQLNQFYIWYIFDTWPLIIDYIFFPLRNPSSRATQL